MIRTGDELSKTSGTLPTKYVTDMSYKLISQFNLKVIDLKNHLELPQDCVIATLNLQAPFNLNYFEAQTGI